MFLMIAAAAATLPGFSSNLRPATPPSSWITWEDWPAGPLERDEQGIVQIRLEISPEGAPSGCDIVLSSGSKDLDATACLLLLKRARFYPIKTSDGQPVAALHRRSVVWALPDQGKLKSPSNNDLEISVQSLPSGIKSPAVVNAEVVVNAQGKIESCVPDSGDALPVLGATACQQVTAQLHPVPARDKSGAPVRTLLIATVQFTADDTTKPVSERARKPSR